MITPEDSGFSVRVAEQREMAHRLLPFVPALGCVAVTDALKQIVVGGVFASALQPGGVVEVAIKHGSFVSDPTLSDQLVVLLTVTGVVLAWGGLGLLYLKTLSELHPRPPVLAVSPPPASPELAPASQPPSTACRGLPSCWITFSWATSLRLPLPGAWRTYGVNHVGQLESSLTAGERNGRNGFRRTGVGSSSS